MGDAGAGVAGVGLQNSTEPLRARATITSKLPASTTAMVQPPQTVGPAACSSSALPMKPARGGRPATATAQTRNTTPRRWREPSNGPARKVSADCPRA